jgi:hypothetical protein
MRLGTSTFSVAISFGVDPTSSLVYAAKKSDWMALKQSCGSTKAVKIAARIS